MLHKGSWLLPGLLIFAAACARSTQVSTPPPNAIIPDTLPTRVLPTPTAVPTTAARSNEGESCDEIAGQIIQAELVAKELPRSLPYRVYLPPCASQAQGQLPTLYLLHGLARTDAQWDELNADEIAQRLVVADKAPPFLIVMPWERLGLEFDQAIVEYLIPYIESEYGASPHPSLRSIGGISRGAGWALRIGLQHSELFQAIGLHSPAVLASDLFRLPGWLEALPEENMPELWIDIGDRDPLRFSLPELTALLDDAGVRYVLRSYPGEHTEAYWAQHVEDYLRWYVSGWLDRELDGRPQ